VDSEGFADWRSPDGERWILHRQDGANGRHPVMGEVYYLLDAFGEKVATFARAPIRSLTEIGPAWTLVQFNNRPLWRGTWPKVWDQMQEMGFTFVCIARVDICADGKRDEFDPMKPIEAATSGGRLRNYSRAEWGTRFLPGSNQQVKRFELGTRGGNKYVRAYCKTKELKTVGAAHKAPYVREAWYQALGGEDPEANGGEVMRLEVVLKGKEVERYCRNARDASILQDIASASGCQSIFASTTSSVYDFRWKPTDEARARSSVRAVVWDFTQSTYYPSCPIILQREKRCVTIGQVTIKATCRTMWLMAQGAQDLEERDVLLNAARIVAERDGLVHWFDTVTMKWAALYRKLTEQGDERAKQMIERAEGTARQFVPPLDMEGEPDADACPF
jgi:hypothetical protein